MTDEIVGVEARGRAASGVRALARREIVRRIFVKVHRTIGLFLGAVIVLVGLSGSMLAYRQAIDERLNANLMLVDIPPQGAFRPLDEILTAAKAIIPPEGVPERLRMPRHRGAAAAVTYMVEEADLTTTFYEIFVDPYTAKVKGQRIYLRGEGQLEQPFIRLLIAFHWTLLLGFNNAYILGTIAIFMFFSILMGLYLWWPRNGEWRQGMRIKWGASPERVAFDVHRSVGVFSAAILVVMLFTGVAMIFKPITRSAVTLLSPVRPDPEYGRSKPIAGQPAIGVDEAVAIADKVFPDGKLRWILLPSKPTSPYVVGKLADNEPNRTQTYRNVGIDQYSGRVLHVQDRNSFTGGERFIEWLFPLHSGEAFGEPARPFILLIGLIPLIMYVTGFLRWRQRRRARKSVAQ